LYRNTCECALGVSKAKEYYVIKLIMSNIHTFHSIPCWKWK